MKSCLAALFSGAAASILMAQTAPCGAATERVLYSFCSRQNCGDGEYPYAGVLRVKDRLYTTTSISGGNGTLVAVNMKTDAAKVVYSFGRHYGDAADPQAGLIDVSGTLYGTAGGGTGNGGNGAGTVYSPDPKTRKAKVLYSFCIEQNCADGAGPVADLLSVNGLLYGTTFGGGANGGGTVFSFDPATASENVLYSFCSLESCADGSEPVASLIEVNGTLYGTTANGGGGGSACSDTGGGCGTVFSLNPSTGIETALHTFGGASGDGGTPLADLINVNGTLYGTTEYGGGDSVCPNGNYDGCGTVFSVDPATGTEKIVYSFKNDNKDGQNPIAGLIEVKGKLYGTTEWGGSYGQGTVFSLDLKTGREEVVYAFCSQTRCNDGANPYAGLIEYKGTLYGTTEGGGTGDQGYVIGGGTVFSITP